MCQHPREPLDIDVVKVVKILNFTYHSDLDLMPIEVWHGTSQVLDAVKRREIRQARLNEGQSSIVS